MTMPTTFDEWMTGPSLDLSFGSNPQMAPSYLSPQNAMLSGYTPNVNYSNLSSYGMNNFPTAGGNGGDSFFPSSWVIGADGVPIQKAGMNFGWNAPSLQLGLQGLGTIGGLYFGNQANKIAKEQLAMTREFGNANLNNSIKNYNTQLTDKANTRIASSGWTPEQAQMYIKENSVSR